MKNRNLYGPFLALLLGIFVSGCSATIQAEPGASAPMVIAQAPKAAPSGGPHEGIQVHGHWVIEVKNPDGTLAEKREFENAYVGGGILPKILAGGGSIGNMFLVLEGDPLPCLAIPGRRIPCPNPPQGELLQPTALGSTLQLRPFPFDPGMVVRTVQNATTIMAVKTRILVCIDISGAVCDPVADFTRAVLDGLEGRPSPIPVSAGQLIDVTVTIRFCCAPSETPPL